MKRKDIVHRDAGAGRGQQRQLADGAALGALPVGRLSGAHHRRLGGRRDGADAALMIALHARRSAASVAAWHAAHPRRPLVLVLTGTDLYRDIDTDAAAQRSLALAQRLVVLNEAGPRRLPPALRDRVTVCLQSAPPRRARPKTARHLRALMVGHLRDEKQPQTYFDAARALAAPQRHPVRPHRRRRSTRRWPRRPGRWPRSSPATAGWAPCRTRPRAQRIQPRTCWCTPAAWKAARMW